MTAAPHVGVGVDALRAAAGIGVAGNFAGHLEQAGEAADFTQVAAEAGAPKGIFPWFVPGAPAPLGTFPLSSDEISLPDSGEQLQLQIEPEVAVLCEIGYDEDGFVIALAPTAVAAFNDCSIRRPGARKISEKKNWGSASKGIARSAMAITDLAADGPTAPLRLASFLHRDGAAHAYGVDSPVVGYSYYGQRLLDWIVDRLRHQQGGTDTPLEPVGAYLREAGCPGRAVIGIGATRYTDVGASTFLRAGDESIVVVYDGDRHTPAQVRDAVATRAEDELAASALRQLVVARRSARG